MRREYSAYPGRRFRSEASSRVTPETRSKRSVNVVASDAGSGIGDVELFVDGNYVDYSRSKSSPYGITWHAGALTPGAHRLKAVAMDALGNRVSTPWVTVVVSG